MSRRVSESQRKRSRGQVLVLVAVAIFAIVGALALCTDIAVFYFNWSQLRKEADAAALAGASYLPTNPSKATATAVSYVGLNGQAGDLNGQPTAGNLGFNGLPNTSITVQLARPVPYYFGRVFGLLQSPVGVFATAAVQPISSASGWIPIGMQCNSPSCFTCTPGSSGCPGYGACESGQSPTQVTLTYDDNSNPGSVTPGNWQPLTCPSGGANGGANAYRAALTSGCNAQLQVSSSGIGALQTKTGSIAKATFDGLSARIGNCGNASCPTVTAPAGVCGSSPSTNLDPTNGRVVLIPLADIASAGSKPATIYGFAVGWIESVSWSSGRSTVVVDVIKGPTTASGTPDPNGPNTGAFAPVLIQ